MDRYTSNYNTKIIHVLSIDETAKYMSKIDIHQPFSPKQAFQFILSLVILFYFQRLHRQPFLRIFLLHCLTKVASLNLSFFSSFRTMNQHVWWYSYFSFLKLVTLILLLEDGGSRALYFKRFISKLLSNWQWYHQLPALCLYKTHIKWLILLSV